MAGLPRVDGGDAEPAQNAALQYWKAFQFEQSYGAEVEGIPLHQLMSEAREGRFTEHAEKVLERAVPYLEKMRLGASLPYCDWGALPWPTHSVDIAHLPPGKSFVGIAAARIIQLIRAGRGEEGVQLLEAGLRFSGHLGGGRLMIEDLVKIACEAILIEGSARELPRLKPVELEMLGRMLEDRLPMDYDPAAAFLNDHMRTATNLLSGLADAPAEELNFKELNDAFSEAGFAEVSISTREELAEFISRLEQHIKSIAALLRETPPPDLKQKVEEYVSRNPMMRGFGEAGAAVTERLHGGRVRLWMLRAAVEALLNGEEAISKFSEPDDGRPFKMHSKFRDTFVMESHFIRQKLPITLRVGNLPAIHHAAAVGDEELVKHHLERNERIDRIDAVGRAPLHHAAAKGQPNMIRFLLKRGADVNALAPPTYSFARLISRTRGKRAEAPVERKTPLDFAIESGHEAAADLLKEHGAKSSAELSEAN
jgi:hypothetical protein